VLIVTGDDIPGHKWRVTGPAIRNLLEKDRRVEARLCEDPDVLATKLPDGYNVIVLHFRNYKPLHFEKEVKEHLAELVREGKGLVIIHWACGLFLDWPEYGKIAGMVWDRKNYHDPYGKFKVRIIDREHPITKGMRDFETTDELYTCLEQKVPVHMLAVARSKKTGRDHPMAFVHQYGKGRVFHTPLGHSLEAITNPGTSELLRRGTCWAGRLAPNP